LLEDCRRGHEHIYTRVFITTKINFRSWRGVLDATLCDIAYQGLAAGQWFFPGSPVSFTNKTDTNRNEILLKIELNTINHQDSNNNSSRHDITEILLKVALNVHSQ